MRISAFYFVPDTAMSSLDEPLTAVGNRMCKILGKPVSAMYVDNIPACQRGIQSAFKEWYSKKMRGMQWIG
jgi:hypothetical protein